MAGSLLYPLPPPQSPEALVVGASPEPPLVCARTPAPYLTGTAATGITGSEVGGVVTAGGPGSSAWTRFR